MATDSSHSKQSSDMPWIIGSGVVLVPTVAWILSSGKGEKHAHHAPKNHAKVAEAVKEVPEESTAEPVTTESTPEAVPEEKPAEVTSEPSASESTISDDDGVVISAEEVEESINKAVDADVPKEAKVVEVAEETSPGSPPTSSESESVKESPATAHPKEEIAESTPPPAPKETSDKKSH